jgi:hypothetical protein
LKKQEIKLWDQLEWARPSKCGKLVKQMLKLKFNKTRDGKSK